MNPHQIPVTNINVNITYQISKKVVIEDPNDGIVLHPPYPCEGIDRNYKYEEVDFVF